MLKNPAILRQAENEQGADSADATATESKRKQVSKRSYLDSAGATVEKIEEATGARYTLLGCAAGNRDFDEQFGKAGEFVTMNAIFGFHTKIGNVANTVLNDKDEPGTPDDAAAAIESFVASGKTGTWAERTTGGVGARIDKDALAAAVMEVATANGQTQGKDGKPLDLASIRQRLEDEPAFVRGVRQVPDVAAAYATRVGKATKAIGDLL